MEIVRPGRLDNIQQLAFECAVCRTVWVLSIAEITGSKDQPSKDIVLPCPSHYCPGSVMIPAEPQERMLVLREAADRAKKEIRLCLHCAKEILTSDSSCPWCGTPTPSPQPGKIIKLKELSRSIAESTPAVSTQTKDDPKTSPEEHRKRSYTCQFLISIVFLLLAVLTWYYTFIDRHTFIAFWTATFHEYPDIEGWRAYWIGAILLGIANLFWPAFAPMSRYENETLTVRSRIWSFIIATALAPLFAVGQFLWRVVGMIFPATWDIVRNGQGPRPKSSDDSPSEYSEMRSAGFSETGFKIGSNGTIYKRE